MADEPNVRVEEGGVIAATWRNLVLVVVSGELTESSADRIRRLALAHVRAQRRAAMLFDALPGVTAPSAQARATLRQLVVEGGASFVCAAIAIETGGFQGSTLRAVVNSLNLFTRPAFPIRSVATLDEAAAWISSEFARAKLPPVARDDIAAAVAALRARPRTPASS